jgi:hypothetical protein
MINRTGKVHVIIILGKALRSPVTTPLQTDEARNIGTQP